MCIRDRSFQTLVCVAAQGLGYLLGALAPCGTAFDVSPYAVIALGSVCFLALVLYGTRALHPSRSETSRPIEFLSLARTREGATDPASDGAIDLDADDAIAEEALGDAEQPHYEDKTALRCDLIGRKYALSQREIEVMALVARGHTISSIATELFISDNTVKTHLRRLYQKLDIHKKQELFALINSCLLYTSSSDGCSWPASRCRGTSRQEERAARRVRRPRRRRRQHCC